MARPASIHYLDCSCTGLLLSTLLPVLVLWVASVLAEQDARALL